MLARLGDALVVRLPRRAVAAALVLHEQRWLPELAPRLPLPIPVPLRAGVPGDGFPWRWSVCPWFDGENAAAATLADVDTAAVALAAFVTALHRPAPADAPVNPFRGVPLAARAAIVHGYLDLVGTTVDQREVRRRWDEAAALPPYDGPPLWLHGDLHPANLVVRDGSLAARHRLRRPHGRRSRDRPRRRVDALRAAGPRALPGRRRRRRRPHVAARRRKCARPRARVSRAVGRRTAPRGRRPKNARRGPHRRRLRAQSERMPCSTVCRVAKRAARIPASSVITRTSATEIPIERHAGWKSKK